ncbi:hypothetical protein [Serratia sp. UGAL515B_01]|uniref:hypothetical protein n=1 Tax=Serratia sp. UGAL515B_01 TaxID=2986763 RepID=UPI0029532A0D|nr:hypothetical protein [Serratia sp. UGAL515B_01]WON77126.1 hypothetical protein OK023_18570 [Serratia sp. UGAL515B_01]
MKNVLNFEEIVQDSRGLWLSALFSSIIGWNPGNDLSDYKDMFFSVLKRLLDDDIVRFCRPDDPLGKMQNYWEAETETIINYLCQRWPEGIADENDESLNMYFYEVPAILWLSESGDYVGS